MIAATKSSSNLISAHHQYEYPAHPSMHGRTLSMASSTGEGGEDLLFAGMSGCFEDEDGISFDDLEQESRDGLGPLDASTSSSSHASGAAANGMAKKGKKLTSTAEKKATHNAVERARRESLNTRFLVLADMLPGMNHVKRASKAAIVNKSIALIQDLQANEQKLTAENEALKAELAILRQRVASGSPPAAPVPVPGPAGPSPFPGIPAAAAFAMPGMPMIPGMPAMMHPGMQMPPPSSSSAAAAAQEEAIRRASMEAAAAAAAASSSANGMPHLYPLGMHNYFGAMPNNLPIVESPTSTSAAIPAVKAESTGSPNSVYSQSIGATIAPFHHQHHLQQQATPAHLASELFPHGLFDFGMTNAGITGSPAPSWTNGASPPCSATDAAGAAANKPPGSSSAASSGPPGLSLGQSSAASPAGSQSSASTSITTPANTFSPIPLPSQHLLHHQHQQCFDGGASTSSGTSPPAAAVAAAAAANANANAVAAMAAFGENADPALLAAQFGPAELAKAQSELSAFIAYQQSMAGFAAAAAAAAAAQQQQQPNTATAAGSASSYQNGAPQPTPSPTETTSFNLPAPQQQQQQQQRINASPVSANNNANANANAAALAAQAAAMGTMPAAWQMMLAQHHQQAQFAAHHQQQHSQQQAQAAAAAAAAMGVAGFGGQY